MRSLRLALPLLFAATALALACGPAQQAGNTPPAAITGPKAGGRLNVWVTQDPTSWDPTISGVSSVSDRYRSLAYRSVLSFKAGPDIDYGTLILTPQIAEKWEVSPDSRTYTFHIRKGVKFHNLPPVNGREITSADVKFSFEYASRTGQFAQMVKDKKLKDGSFTWWFEGMESVETPDASTVVVKFKEPFAPFINYAAVDKNGIYAKEIFDKEGHFEDTLVGAGPYMLDNAASQKGTRWVMKKNPSYFEAGKPYIDEIYALVLPEFGTAAAAFKTKQLDMLGGTGRSSGYSMSHEDLKRVQGDVPNAVIYPVRSPSPENMYINSRRAPFNNVKARQALSLAIDRDELIRVFSGGEGEWALAGAFPDTFSKEEIHKIVKYDPEQAKKLLAEAGYGNGVNIEYYDSQAYGQSHWSEAELIQAQLKRVGINMSIKILDHAAYLAQTRGNTFDLAFRSKAMMGDVDSYLYAVFHPTSNSNYGGVNDPELTPMLEAQRREADPAKRKEIIRKAVQLIAERTWGVALMYDVNFDTWYPVLKNYAPNWGNDGWPLTEAWLEK